MIHSKLCQPRIFPHNSARAPEQIDRAQDIGGDLTLNQDKLYEIGRDGKLGVNKKTPSLAYSMTQFEYGSMSFWYSLANVVTPGGTPYDVNLDDIKATTFDITAYMTDDDNTFKGTMWFPNLRINGFSINIGDPDAIVERKFDLVGEDFKILDGKYFAYNTAVVGADGEKTITLSPASVEYASGKNVFRVLRIRAGVCTELVEDAIVAYAADTWRYSAGDVIVQTCLIADIIKVYYEASTAYATLWTNNDVDSDALLADSCEIYLKVGTGTRIYRLQSVGIDVALERTDYKEIGNNQIVQRGVKSKTVTIKLDRFNEGFSLEDILASDTTYPYINPRDYAGNIQLQVKIFADNTHAAFKMGYLINNISPTTLGTSQAIEDYNKVTDTLESDNLKISSVESEIAFS